ncbi:MAG: lysophospholipid acyltransferase family protein [Propionibacteriaceae bacterium]
MRLGRAWPLRAAREVLQTAGRPLLAAGVTLQSYGVDGLTEEAGPYVIVANHASHLDAVVLLAGLPAALRRRTAVAAPVDRFASSWWRSAGALVTFHTVPVDRSDWSLAGEPARLLAQGWNLVVFPEGSRSPDGFPGTFRLDVAALAVAGQVPVVPVGIRGAYAAMPRGRGWPTSGRPRVSVRWGEPLRPRQGESAEQLNERVAAAVAGLVDEDATTWWRAQQAVGAGRPGADPDTAGYVDDAVVPPVGSWRRIWTQSEPPVAGGRPRRVRIWSR